MDNGKLDDDRRLFLTRKLHRHRMELWYEAWAEQEFFRRFDTYGRLTRYEELSRDYEALIEMRWPSFRDYAKHHYSDEELIRYVDAYALVANERMQHGTARERMRNEEALDGSGRAAEAYRNVLQDHRLRDQRAAPANDNRAGASVREPADVEESPAEETGPGIPPAAPEPAHRARFQTRDDAKGLDR